MKRYMKLMPNYQCVVKHELKYNPWKYLVESMYNSRYPVCTTRDIQYVQLEISSVYNSRYPVCTTRDIQYVQLEISSVINSLILFSTTS